MADFAEYGSTLLTKQEKTLGSADKSKKTSTQDFLNESSFTAITGVSLVVPDGYSYQARCADNGIGSGQGIVYRVLENGVEKQQITRSGSQSAGSAYFNIFKNTTGGNVTITLEAKVTNPGVSTVTVNANTQVITGEFYTRDGKYQTPMHLERLDVVSGEDTIDFLSARILGADSAATSITPDIYLPNGIEFNADPATMAIFFTWSGQEFRGD